MKQNMSHNLRRLLCRNDGFDRYARFAAIPSAEIYRSVGLLRTEYAPVMELVDMRDLGSRAAMRAGSSPFRRTKKKGTPLACLSFWFSPPRGRLHPSVIEMLEVNELPLRRGFRLRRKRSYGAKAPPRRAGPHVLLASILLRCSIVGASFAKLAPIF